LLRDRRFQERGYFDTVVVESVVSEHLRGVVDHSEALWSLLNLELWCRTFIDADASAFPRVA
jgi:hypothetical protein